MLGVGIGITQLASRQSPSGPAYYLTGPNLPGGIGFGRSSQAVVTASNGLLVEQPTDTPRFDHDPQSQSPLGLWIEPAATNVLLHSNDLSNVTWTNERLTLSSNATVGPFGTASMDRITASQAGNDGSFVEQSVAGITVGQPYTISAYVRRDEHRYAGFWGFGNHSSGVGFDLQNLTAQVNGSWISAGIEPVSGDLARIWGHLSPISNNVLKMGIFANLSGGKSLTGGESLSVGHVQVEAGSIASSYIETDTTTASRAADAAQINGVNGLFDVHITYDDDSTEIAASQAVTNGYWPTLSRPRVKKIKLVEV